MANQGLGLEALTPRGLVGKTTIGRYSRDGLSPGVAGILDALSDLPAASKATITSGYRSPSRNKKAGGAKRSQHMLGNAIDIDISKLSKDEKKAVLDAAIAAGAKGIGVYKSGNVLHVDPRATPTVWGPNPKGAYAGLSQKQFGLLPDWAGPSITGLFGGKLPSPSLPETMQAPRSKPETTFAGEYAKAADSMAQAGVRGIGATQQFSAPVGKVERGPALAAPSPARPDNVASAGPSFASPARPDNLDFAGPKGSFSVPDAPAASPSPAGLAAAYGQMASTMQQAGVPQIGLSPAMAASMARPAAPAPAPAPAAAPVAAPALSAPKVVAPPPAVFTQMPARPVSQTPAQAYAPAAPSFTPGDIYGGQVGSAMSSSGNLVGRDQFGFTSVTNKHGATTVTTPGGMQAAGTTIGSAQQPGGLGGMFGGKLGGAVKSGVGAYAGSMVGGLLGPVGSVLGAVVGKELAKPGGGLIGGLINGTKTFDTAWFGPVKTNKAQGGLGFPGAPSGGYKGSASFSNRSEGGMRDISPGAAAAIGAGKGGLY